MIIGVPKEIKDNEARVGVTPAGVKALTEAGHKVLVETQAGAQSGFPDAEYQNAGAEIVGEAGYVWGKAEMVVKVKEPIEREYVFFREGLVLFTYLHLAPLPELTDKLLESKVIGIAYETVRDRQGTLPLLTPMSEVAGRMSVQVGATLPGKRTRRAGDSAGRRAGRAAGACDDHGRRRGGHQRGEDRAGLWREDNACGREPEPAAGAGRYLWRAAYTLASNSYNVAQATREADLVIGGVLIPGATAPKLVTRAMVAQMKKGAVIVDVAIDQGGCVETARPTSHSDPSLCGGWRGALLRDEHAGRGAAHFDAGADQLDVSVCAADCEPGRARGVAAGRGIGRGAEYVDGHADAIAAWPRASSGSGRRPASVIG